MVNPDELKLFYEPKDRLRLTLGEEKSYLTVKPVWAAPVSRPGAYLALLDGKGEEIALLPDPGVLSPENAAILEAELRLRYLTALVTAIVHARQEYGATYWSVETDRGPRDFVTQSLQENAQWFSETHLLLLDVDGNRFEITDVTALDARSQAIIGAIL
ncbi:MAG TPA: DUF1854 domain-containing protein [Chthonomonadaceae bacterium]|nr:DUF1854 domain-containing protein [Chthonomonadaceae bacterium]